MTNWHENQNLPQSIRDGLTTFCEQAQSSLGEDLISLVAFGPLARGDAVAPKVGKVQVMVVMQSIPMEHLDALAPLLQQGREDFGLTVLLLTEQELKTSADVFPIKFLDMKQHHILLGGKDLLSDLEVQQEYLRLRCEQEMKNLSLRLRAFYLHGFGQPAELHQILLQTGIAFVGTLRGYLCLTRGESPRQEIEVAQKAATEMKLDFETLKTVLALQEQSQPLSQQQARELFDRFRKCVSKAATIADAYQADD